MRQLHRFIATLITNAHNNLDIVYYTIRTKSHKNNNLHHTKIVAFIQHTVDFKQR